VSFDFNVAYSSRWGYSLIKTLKLKKIKKDRDGNILEYRAHCSADGRQQEVGSHGDTFAPTFEIQLFPINVRHCSNDADLSDIGEPVYIQGRSEDLQDRRRISACRHLHQGTASGGFPASLLHHHGRVSLNYIWHERRARLLCDSWHKIVIYLCCVIHDVWSWISYDLMYLCKVPTCDICYHCLYVHVTVLIIYICVLWDA